MYKLYIPEPVLTTGNHIEAVKALGTIKQQLEEYRQYNQLAARRLQWLTDLLVERFDPTSEVMKKFKKWNKKSFGDTFNAFRMALSVDYDSVDDEDFLKFGHIYCNLEDWYLDEESFKRLNSALN